MFKTNLGNFSNLEYEVVFVEGELDENNDEDEERNNSLGINNNEDLVEETGQAADDDSNIEGDATMAGSVKAANESEGRNQVGKAAAGNMRHVIKSSRLVGDEVRLHILVPISGLELYFHELLRKSRLA